MKIRKCSLGEISKIVEVADKSFAPDRKKGFTFKKSLPRIYNNKNHDYSEIHFIAKNKDNEFVAVVGNLIDDIKINNKSYKFSRIGTVGTIPAYRGCGCMKQLMSAVDKENRENDVVFSILCGKRNRYKNFGYERMGMSCYYIFDKDQQRYLRNDYNIFIKQFEKKDLDDVYSIYVNNSKFVLRSKEEFESYLNTPKSKLYTVSIEDEIIGYFSSKSSMIIEINLSNYKYLESVIFAMISQNNLIEFYKNQYNSQTFQISANMLNKSLCEELDKLAEYKNIGDEYSIKVYNLEKFIEMIYLINDFKEKKISEKYKIGETIYNFKFNKELRVLKTKGKFLKEFQTQAEFLRFALGNDSFFDNVSRVFPLLFDMNIADDF